MKSENSTATAALVGVALALLAATVFLALQLADRGKTEPSTATKAEPKLPALRAQSLQTVEPATVG